MFTRRRIVKMNEIPNNEKKITTPYSARLPEDLKERLTSTLSASGYSTVEFFEKMVGHFQQIEGTKPKRPEVTEMTKAIKRINDAFESLVLAVEVSDSDKSELSTKYASEAQIAAQELESVQLQAVESNKALRQTIKDIESQKTTIETENTDLKKEIDRLKQVEELIGETRTEAKAAKESLKVATADRDTAITTAQTATTAQAAAESTNSTLRAQLESIQSESAAKSTTIQNLTEKLEKCSELKNQALGELNAIRPQAQQLQKEIADLRAQLDQKRLQNLNLSQSLKLAETQPTKTPMESVLTDIEDKAPDFIK
jgi:DNA repair exonuclease SbcCD ATPase subunit